MISILEIVLRLVLSIVLSGIIGIERESIKKPAGFRTHILVCVGSTLVMLLSLHIFYTFQAETSLQPDRLGAQVISGIGFLGAGTILREGSTVKGLTTAASLWAVGCIGLAVGAGFYTGALLTAFFVLVTLMGFSKVEKHIKTKRNLVNIKIISYNKPGQLGRIGQVVGDMGLTISNIELDSEDDEIVIIYMIIMIPNQSIKLELINRISRLDNIIEILQ